MFPRLPYSVGVPKHAAKRYSVPFCRCSPSSGGCGVPVALVFATTEAERRPVTSVYIEIQQWKGKKGGYTYDGL